MRSRELVSCILFSSSGIAKADLLLTKVELGVSQAHIGQEIFLRGVYVFPSFDVILSSLSQQVSFSEISQIDTDGGIVYLCLLYGSKSVFKFLRVR